ncbi:hypothetical protein COHA_006655 [Chlorella ohadii]|uniref:Uncharacterized protein n=1 Tax=Chlorella ohadii TaxID=2649997 RepID=A0AAD5DNG5_9CHLO|nr:hypothetical protein COHA_006655 [Chlorella ohadii]
MLTTLSLQPGLAGLGRAALCSAPLLLQRVAAASTAAAMHEGAVAAQQHHRPAHKQKSKDAFSITPFLAKPGQGRRASVDATEWSDRLRRLDFGLPRGPRYARNVAAASPCKPIASAHPGFRHSHHELNKGIASHLASPHFQATY